MPDKPNHHPGCILVPHTGLCVVPSDNLVGVNYGVIMESAFVPRLTGDTVYDQIQAALRVAPGSTHIQYEYIWQHREARIHCDQLGAHQNPEKWKRMVRVVGRVESPWRDADTPMS